MRLSWWDGHCAKCFVDSRIHLLLKIIPWTESNIVFILQTRMETGGKQATCPSGHNHQMVECGFLSRWSPNHNMTWAGGMGFNVPGTASGHSMSRVCSCPVSTPFLSGNLWPAPSPWSQRPRTFLPLRLASVITFGVVNQMMKAPANCHRTGQWPQCFQIKFLKRP